MLKNGLNKIFPDHRDFSIVHTFGATVADTQSLPDNFSIYNGQIIPNQNLDDTRFTPTLPPQPYGCTGEAQSFGCGLEDQTLFNPKFTYDSTSPGGDGGRDLRASLQSTIDKGLQDVTNTVGFNRAAYFNCYGSGTIDDYDAAKIGIWINQNERRFVTVGSYWYPEFENPQNGILPTPSFNTSQASLHNWIITGWKTINGVECLEGISWQGMNYGNNGLHYVSRELYNALMAQPYTAAYTLTKSTGQGVPIGYTAIIDHLVYFIKNLFHV